MPADSSPNKSAPGCSCLGRLVCIYEDRHHDIVGVKLLLLSLEKYAPGERIRLYFRDAPETLQRFAARFPDVELIDPDRDFLGGWNVKPGLLTSLIDEGFDEIIFIDSDIILTGPLLNVVPEALPAGTLVVADEYAHALHNGGYYRTDQWGMPRGRSHPRTLNTCVIRVTPQHRRLLERWQHYSACSYFQDAQAKPWNERPLHLVGGQDVLTAMAGSAEFRELDVRFIARGQTIAQCFMEDGFTSGERLMTLVRGMPSMVHAQGGKPWREGEGEKLYVQLSPYAAAADDYVDPLDEPIPWSRPRRPAARLLHLIAFGHPALRGIGPSLYRETRRVLGWIARQVGLKSPPPTLLAKSDTPPPPHEMLSHTPAASSS